MSTGLFAAYCASHARIFGKCDECLRDYCDELRADLEAVRAERDAWREAAKAWETARDGNERFAAQTLNIRTRRLSEGEG